MIDQILVKEMKKNYSKHMYYLKIAEAVADKSTCLRAHYGAVLVKDDRIVGTGYNGAPRGRENCNDRGSCYRIINKISSGTRYETCRAVHAEMNAIINSNLEDRKGAILYLAGFKVDQNSYRTDKSREFMECCEMCKRAIINAGISKVVTYDLKGSINTIEVKSWIFSEKLLADEESKTLEAESQKKENSDKADTEWLRTVLEGYLSLIAQNSETPVRHMETDEDSFIVFSVNRLKSKIDKVLSQYTPEEARLYQILIRSFDK